MKIDFARAKAKRDSCLYYRYAHSQPVCEQIGKRPFLATCYSCRYYAPRVALAMTHTPRKEQQPRACAVCGAPLNTMNPKVKRCAGACKQNLLTYFPTQKIIIEHIQLDDLYGVPLT